jgi:hypothetical protein
MAGSWLVLTGSWKGTFAVTGFLSLTRAALPMRRRPIEAYVPGVAAAIRTA